MAKLELLIRPAKTLRSTGTTASFDKFKLPIDRA